MPIDLPGGNRPVWHKQAAECCHHQIDNPARHCPHNAAGTGNPWKSLTTPRSHVCRTSIDFFWEESSHTQKQLQRGSLPIHGYIAFIGYQTHVHDHVTPQDRQ